jgi:hypothetical protein
MDIGTFRHYINTSKQTDISISQKETKNAMTSGFNCDTVINATGWTIEVLGLDSRRGQGIFLFTTASRTALELSQPRIQWVPGDLSLGVKRPGREADHSPPSNAEIKMSGTIPPLPQYALMAWCSVKAQGQLYLCLAVINEPLKKVREFSSETDTNCVQGCKTST